MQFSILKRSTLLGLHGRRRGFRPVSGITSGILPVG